MMKGVGDGGIGCRTEEAYYGLTGRVKPSGGDRGEAMLQRREDGCLEAMERGTGGSWIISISCVSCDNLCISKMTTEFGSSGGRGNGSVSD